MAFSTETSNDFCRDLNTKHFIEEVQLRPAIWDTSCDDYNDKKRRRECWEELTLLFLEKSDVATPVSEAEREIFMPPTKRTRPSKKQKFNQNFKKTRTPKFQYSEENLRQALLEIQEGRMSVRRASREFSVPKTTLQDHKSGKIPKIPRKTGPQPLLNIEGEKKLVDWVLTLAKCGFPVKKSDLLQTVEAIVKNTEKESLFKDGKPGQKWYLNFLKRHPIISVREAESINKARAIISEECIRAWFHDLRKYLKETKNEDILEDPDRILNGDEAGFSLDPKTGKVLAPRGWKNLYSIKMGNEKDNITVLLVFTASGKICPPLVVFPYIRPPKAIVENMPSNWVLGRSDSGWMKGDVFFEYVANDFSHWVTQTGLKKPILVLIDGHKSHMTLPLSEFCDRNGIILYALPPNTTHIMQPADVSVFKPLKTEWKKTVRKWQSQPENVNHSVNKINFCRVFHDALTNTNMEDHIKKGFRKCGLYPFDANSVDYTKCVKNLLEKQNISSIPETHGQENPTPCEIKSAKRVIEAIRGKLTGYGINVDLIMDEIIALENSADGTASNTLVGAIFPLGDFQIHDVEIFSSEFISETEGNTDDPPCFGRESVNIRNPRNLDFEDLQTDKEIISSSHTINNGNINENEGSFTEKATSEINESLHDEHMKDLSSMCNQDDQVVREKSVVQDESKSIMQDDSSVTEKENIQKIPDDIPAEVDENMGEDQRHGNMPETSLVRPNEDRPKLQNLDQNITYIPLKVAFDSILKFKCPKDIPASSRKEKEKAPKAINSQLWRDFQNKKEEEKRKKAEDIAIRKQRREAAREEKKLKTKKKMHKKESENENDETSTSKEKANCAACQEELNTDTEDEDNKNIGCDNCPKWFHLRCTEFYGLSYEDAAAEDYICYTCS